MQHAKISLFSLKWNFELLYYLKRRCLELPLIILFMFEGHTNPKLCVSLNAIVANLCKITVLRKRQPVKS